MDQLVEQGFSDMFLDTTIVVEMKRLKLPKRFRISCIEFHFVAIFVPVFCFV